MYLLVAFIITSACSNNSYTMTRKFSRPKEISAQPESAELQLFMKLCDMDKTEMYGTFNITPEYTYSKTKLEKEMEIDFEWAMGKLLAEIEESSKKKEKAKDTSSKAHVVDLETFPLLQSE
ncbi:MAG: hypothetical protein ACHQVS_02605, partial [Candidatus Babeliales bacterium]